MKNSQLMNVFFFISLTVPYIVASPDALVSCSCCGKGCLEIKCSFDSREKFVYEIMNCDDSYLEGDFKNRIKLKTTYMYYYRIQCQLDVAGRIYSDFYVWTEKDYHYKTVFPGTEFWIENRKFCEIIFRLCLLHQLTGKFYFSAKATPDSIDNTVVNNPNNDKSDSQRWYCYCLSEEFGEMIACDFIMCSIEWFHIKYQRENDTALIIKT